MNLGFHVAYAQGGSSAWMPSVDHYAELVGTLTDAINEIQCGHIN